MIIRENVAGLLLDEQNPRFRQQVDGQDEAITSLLLDGHEKLLSLARDIATEGTLNPTELPVVVREDGDLVVIEGNRRLAAIKLLRAPNLAASADKILGDSLVEKFKKIRQLGVGPDSIEVYEAESRDAARHWIELRHTGENDGVGVVSWESWQTNNYRRRRGSQADRASMFCDAVEIDFPEETDLRNDVATVRSIRLTTLGRLVADPDVRRDFGVRIEGEQVLFEYLPEDLRAGFVRLFGDLASGTNTVTVTHVKTKDLRRKYVADRSAVLPDRSKRLSTPRLPGEPPSTDTHIDVDTSASDANPSGAESDIGTGSTQSGATNNTGKGKDCEDTNSEKGNRSRTPPRENVIFKSLKMPHVNPRTRDLLKQSHGINIDDSASISGILVRVLLELTVTEAIECGVITGAKESDTLKKKIRMALLTLDPQCESPTKRDKSLEMAWTRSQDGDALAVQSLNAFVHNIHGNAAPSEVRTLSQTFRPVLERLDELIGKAAK